MSDIDLEKYLHHLEHIGGPREKKIRMLKALMQVLQNRIDCAFGDDPVQHMRQSAALGGREDKSDAKDASKSPRVLGSNSTTEKETEKSLSDAFRDQRGSGGGSKE